MAAKPQSKAKPKPRQEPKPKPKPRPKAKLDRYRAKRDFASTPEPAGGEGDRGSGADGRFVVQEHDATRLHWDLRLEHDGVLVSWAIPNGIPMSPKENRKAVHVEDHPLDYIDFEGVIPEGYGAGTVKLWDTGTYELEKWEPKKVMVTFHGDRLNGRYALFEAGSKKDWLIHRMDPPADPEREPMPARVVPMLAKLGTLPARDDDFGFEIKWDGIRALAYYEPGRFHIESRNLNDITAQYPELRRLGRQLGSRDTILDGEIVAFDERGRPSFARLQHRMHLTREADIKRRVKDTPVHYVLFDVLYLEGRSVMSRPYVERRELLESLGLEGPNWQTPSYRRGSGKELVEASAKNGLEGVVAKKLDSTYSPGRRNPHWIKVKNKRRVRLVIAGWLPEKERADRLGALLVGYFDSEGHFRYAGRVGTGFDAQERTRLERLLAPLEREGSPFEGKRGPRGASYVEPRLVAEVEFTEWTNDGVLRHPSYKGLFDDEPESIVLDPENSDEPDPVEEAVLDCAETSATLGPIRAVGRKAVEVTVEDRRLRLTNLDKVMYPKTGFTKRDLIDYFVRIAPVLLPHLHDRPLTLKRYPDGVEGQFFYEKKCPSHRPDWVRTESVWSRHNKANIDFCVVDDVPTLVWLANLADIELHTSMALAREVSRPTMMVFDLDPGPPADIVACCRVGLMLRDMFEQLGLQSFAKTSGSKGMQVYVPLNRPVTYDDTKPFARVVAELMEKQHPELIVSRMTKSLRDGKVFIDWSQNDEHKTTVCVYSLRARDQPTVSTPVTWDEVADALKRRSAKRLTFEYTDVLRRVERDGDLFAPVLALKQELPKFGKEQS